MRKSVTIVFLALALSGCAHHVFIAGRDNGLTGQTTVTTSAGQNGGPFSITLGKEHFTGRWVYVANGGSISFINATAISRGQSASAFGTGLGIPTQGNGSVIASAPDGNTLRCIFDYNQWSKTGMGQCQDRHGELYDLQIN